MIKRIASNYKVWLAVSLFCTLVSIVASVRTRDWVWFQRSGSILTVVGAITAGRSIVRQGRAGAKPAPQLEVAKLGAGYVKNGIPMARGTRSAEAVARHRENEKDATAMV